MYLVPKEISSKIPCFFNLKFENRTIDAYLSGIMGDAWVDDLQYPAVCQVIVGDYCFICGNPIIDSSRVLAGHIPTDYSSSVLVVMTENNKWKELLLEMFGNKATVSKRYSTILNQKLIDIGLLNSFINDIPNQYKIVPINRNIFQMTKQQKWALDLCAHFSSFEDYFSRGIGYAVLLNNELVVGASSYLSYKKGIEIEVQTKMGHRRKGLALACSAQLVTECLKRGIYPNWDAANIESLCLAKKLGYVLKAEYPVVIISTRKEENKL